MYTLNSILVNKRGLDTGVKGWIHMRNRKGREHFVIFWHGAITALGSSAHSHRLLIFVLFHATSLQTLTEWITSTITAKLLSCLTISVYNLFLLMTFAQVHLSIYKVTRLFGCRLSHTLYTHVLDMLVYCKSIAVCVIVHVFQGLCLYNSLLWLKICVWRNTNSLTRGHRISHNAPWAQPTNKTQLTPLWLRLTVRDPNESSALRSICNQWRYTP